MPLLLLWMRRCRIDKASAEHDGSGSYAANSLEDVGCEPMGYGTADSCMDWENNMNIRVAVAAFRKELLTAMITDDDERGVAAAAGAVAPPPPPPPGGGSRLPFQFDTKEVGHAYGVLPAVLTAAARSAQELGWGRRRPGGCPAGGVTTGATSSAGAGPAQAGVDGDGEGQGSEQPWLVYVASDSPLFVALAHASPSLQGRVLTAGREAGSIGNVFSGFLCSEAELARGEGEDGAAGCRQRVQADPSGAWTRSIIDLWLISQADVLFRVGGRFQEAVSGFALAAERMTFPGPGRLGLRDWGFKSPLTMDGKFLEPTAADRLTRVGSETFEATAEAIAGLEATGLGGSGV